MEHFVDEISDDKFKLKSIDILQKRKPFRNFNYEIDNSEYRETWFEFKQKEK